LQPQTDDLSAHLLLLLLAHLLLLLLVLLLAQALLAEQRHASLYSQQLVTCQLAAVVGVAAEGSNRDNPARHDDADYAGSADYATPHAAVAAAALAAAAAGC
jgi:hypothetical protein